MAPPLLSALREAPVIGRFYMVPVVEYHWRGRTDRWPVLGVAHHDREHIGFPHIHYHFDARFLNRRQLDHVHRQGGAWIAGEDRAVNGSVLTEPAYDIDTPRFGRIARRPSLLQRKCQRPIQAWTAPDAGWLPLLEEQYGAPADAIYRPDGRKLCPHRKADLSQFPMDAEGIVTCPLHGLRVRCAA